MKHIDPAVRRTVVARLREKRGDGESISADVRRAAAGLLIAESTVWRWLATRDDTDGDDTGGYTGGDDPQPERPTRAGYVLTGADRDDYLDWRGNIAALRRARIAAGGRDVPPLRTLQRAFAAQMTAAERAAAVDGVEGRRRHEVYLRWEPAARNMRWEADHKELPVQVTPPRGTRPVKPWVTLFLDCYSRLIMGWALSLRPDSAMVLAAMRRGLVIDPERGPFGGIPQSLVPDGGREFDARHGAAVLQRHTIDATSTAEVLTRVRAVQAGFFTAGVFLQLPPRPGLPTTRVNFAPRLGPAGVERIRGLCSPAASAVLAIAATTGLRAGALRSIRLRDVLDTGPDQHVVAGGALYRVPGCVAGLIRAALIERHAQLAGEPATAAGCGPGGAGLFTGRDPETAVSERSLQQVLDRAAAYAGVTVSPPSFPGVAVHDLRGTA